MGKLFDLSNAGKLSTPITPESLVHQYLPASFGASDALKKQIKVKHMMTMSSGIKPADSSAFDLTLDQALTHPMSAAPGEMWSYASLPPNLLSIVVQNVSGVSLQNFFNTHIARPIGATVPSWGSQDGYNRGAAGAFLNARNLARIGYLLLRKGQWNSGSGLKQVMRASTISLLTHWASFLQGTTAFESVTPFFAPDPESHNYYGHFFWTNRTREGLGTSVPATAYYMHGFRDKLCIVIPSLDMIVIRLVTGGPGMDPTFRSEFMSRIMAAVVPDPGNRAPLVNAGPDQTVSLPNSANLNGTVTDDGLPNPPAAVSTRWSKASGPGTVTFGNPNAVDTSANFTVSGSYVLRLTANDSALTAQDSVAITVNPPGGGTVSITIEAENGARTAPMVTNVDSAASGGAFVEVPEGTGNNYNDATNGGPGQVAFSVSISQPTTYAFWARTIAANGSSDSFYVTRNGALLKEWSVPSSTNWTWRKITNLSLPSGSTNFGFRQREDGTKLDKIMLTSDLNFIPASTQ